MIVDRQLLYNEKTKIVKKHINLISKIQYCNRNNIPLYEKDIRSEFQRMIYEKFNIYDVSTYLFSHKTYRHQAQQYYNTNRLGAYTEIVTQGVYIPYSKFEADVCNALQSNNKIEYDSHYFWKINVFIHSSEWYNLVLKKHVNIETYTYKTDYNDIFRKNKYDLLIQGIHV